MGSYSNLPQSTQSLRKHTHTKKTHISAFIFEVFSLCLAPQISILHAALSKERKGQCHSELRSRDVDEHTLIDTHTHKETLMWWRSLAFHYIEPIYGINGQIKLCSLCIFYNCSFSTPIVSPSFFCQCLSLLVFTSYLTQSELYEYFYHLVLSAYLVKCAILAQMCFSLTLSGHMCLF